jgi:high-affinity nickel permease
MTDEQRAAKITALVEERRGYVLCGDTDHVAAVDAELRRLGAEGAPAVAKAAKR